MKKYIHFSKFWGRDKRVSWVYIHSVAGRTITLSIKRYQVTLHKPNGFPFLSKLNFIKEYL